MININFNSNSFFIQKNINQLILSKVSDQNKMELFDCSDRRQITQQNQQTQPNQQTQQNLKKTHQTIEDKMIEEINTSNIREKYKSWIGVTDLIKLLGGEHIINIKKILSPIMSFKPTKKNVHEF
jgi:hypothetical protein